VLQAAVVVVGLLNAVLVRAALPAQPPPFSWATVPVFMHSQNKTGPFNDTALEFMARFPIVTIGGGQDLGVKKCCNEEKVVVAARGIKAYNKSTRVLYYQNALINFPQVHLNSTVDSSLLLHDKDGKLVSLGQCGHMHGVNHTLFDHSNPKMRKAWIDNAVEVVRKNPELIDGVFCDRGGSFAKAAAIDLPCVEFESGKLRAWDVGHWQMIADLQEAVQQITKTAVIIGNHVAPTGPMNLKKGSDWSGKMFETFLPVSTNYVPPGDQLPVLIGMDSQRIAEVHVDYCSFDQKGGLPAAYTLYEQSLAAFLIGAGEYSYYACTGNSNQGWGMNNGWDQWSLDYSRPLGKPLGLAAHNTKTNVWHRKFASGTQVWLDGGADDWKAGWGTPCIQWADGHTTGKNGCDKYYSAQESESS